MKSYVKKYKGYDVPEGAEEFGCKNEFYPHASFYKNKGSEVFILNEWRRTISNRKDLIPLPEEPAQSKSEWMPNVGEECEYESIGHHDGFEWCIFQGVMSDGSYIIEYHHCTSPGMTTCFPFDPSLTKFRPIKTKEEEEREAFIEKAKRMARATDDVLTHYRLFGLLFDSGARFTAPKGDNNE